MVPDRRIEQMMQDGKAAPKGDCLAEANLPGPQLCASPARHLNQQGLPKAVLRRVS
jgi:hypothetical protein